MLFRSSTNQFDAACGFGGYRESGIGREGGLEGLFEYLKPAGNGDLEEDIPPPAAGSRGLPTAAGSIDRTAKMYVGGKQVRPDGGNSFVVYGNGGEYVGLAGEGNRKDIRNAVEAAFKASPWARTSAHNRAQIL